MKKYAKGIKFKALVHTIGMIQGKTYETCIDSDLGVCFINELHQADMIFEGEINNMIELLQPLVYVTKSQANQFNIPVQRCSHEFKNYIGLVDTYEYCTKCDAKKGKGVKHD